MLQLHQERRFLNNYGVSIYEDILHFAPTHEPDENMDSASRNYARYILERVRDDATRKGSVKDLDDAIAGAELIQSSPLMRVRKMTRHDPRNASRERDSERS